jgi:hypothetical protein
MTDEEIVAKLQEGDRLMEQYKATLQPVLDELAERKSVFVFGERGRYRGEFGCFDEGSDSLCLHIKDHEAVYALPFEEQGTLSKRAYAFADQWRERSGVKHIWLTGHH